MSKSNVVDLLKYKNESVEQLPPVVEMPAVFSLVEKIASDLFENDVPVKHYGSTLFMKVGDGEFGLTVRPIESHWENLGVWTKHVAEKYRNHEGDEPIDLTIEEIMILQDELGESETTEDK